MKIIVNETGSTVTTVKDLPMEKAFKYNERWYMKININDNEIPPNAYDDFFDKHVLEDGWNEDAESYDDYTPCLMLDSNIFCYLRNDTTIFEYGRPTLSVALYQ